MISLIILFFELISSNSIFYFSFKTNKTSYSKNHLSIINHIQNNFIYTSIIVGSNKHSIPVFLRISKSYSLSLPNSNVDSNLKYNKYDINSKSLEMIDEKEQSFYSENINKGFKGEEFFYLKNLNNNKEKIRSKFIISTEQKIIGGGQLGFFFNTLGSLDDLKDYNLMNNLINNNKIKNNVFSVEYTSENEGKIYLGGFPDEFTKKYLNIDYLYVNNIENTNWAFSIDNIFSGEEKIDNFINCIIDYESGFINANFEYFKIINKTFFEKYSKDCSSEFYNKKYYLICNKNININKFPDLIFNLDSIKFNLTLKGKDLFKQINNNYYFLVSFNTDDDSKKKWILGKPLLKKYLFVFNREFTQIGLYSKTYNLNSINYPKIILFILILLIIVLAIFIVLKKKNIIKFKKANELLENNFVDSILSTNNNNENSDYKMIN